MLLLDEDEGNCDGTDCGIRLQLSVVGLVMGGGDVLVAALPVLLGLVWVLLLELEVRLVSLLFETALLTSDIFGAISPSHNPHNDINSCRYRRAYIVLWMVVR